MALFLTKFIIMQRLGAIVCLLMLLSCQGVDKRKPFTSVSVTDVYEDSVSIRAIELMGESLAFAGSNGIFGSIDVNTHKVRTNIQKYDSITPEFRAVGHTSTDFFMLSVATPALLYKTGDQGRMELVYKEEGEHVFYDSLKFFNDSDGIAVGDSFEGCLSILMTDDGGNNWSKLPCDELPKALEGEGAFAASNTNIEIQGDKVWIATTGGRLYHSTNKGKTWTIQDTPIEGSEPTQGIYSLDFYNEEIGVAIGGDYTQPDGQKGNKAITLDGGHTWKLIADGLEPGYKSCIQFVPKSEGKEIVALGFTGISYSSDQGKTWSALSQEPFYTLRFVNDSVAYAAGKNRISRLVFK